MKWWCSATGEPWTWAWQPYPGVWLFVLAIGLWYWLAVRRHEGPHGHAGPQRRQTAWFLAGLLSIWLALDWPLGALGAGYLTSVHTVSYILLVMVAVPCIIQGIPVEQMQRVSSSGAWSRPLWLFARPWFALAIFNLVVLGTHMPRMVDGLMATQVGAFAVSISWLVAGFALWWPVMGPPAVVQMKRPMKMAYLFASTLLPIIPSAFLTFSDFPIYATYELAPRLFPTFSARYDQQVAGLLMKIVGDLPVWFGFAVIFFRWSREGRQNNPIHPSVIRQQG